MKSTASLRPATPPWELMYWTAALTPFTPPWNRPGANGLFTSATTAMRISRPVTPMSVAFAAAADCAEAGAPTASTAPAARLSVVTSTARRLMISPGRLRSMFRPLVPRVQDQSVGYSCSVDMDREQARAQTLAVAVEVQRLGDAPAERAVQHELQGVELRQLVPIHGRDR